MGWNSQKQKKTNTNRDGHPLNDVTLFATLLLTLYRFALCTKLNSEKKCFLVMFLKNKIKLFCLLVLFFKLHNSGLIL